MSNENINVKEYTIDFLDIIGVVFKNLKLIITITSIFMIYILTFSIISIKLPTEKSFYPNVFTAKSIVIINSSSSSSGLYSLLSGTGMDSIASLAGISSDSVSDSDLAMKLVRTNSFIKKISEKFNMYEVYSIDVSVAPKTQIKEILNDKLVLTKDPTTGLLEITYTDTNKELATQIVNSVTDLLEEEFSKIDSIKNRDQYSVVSEKIIIVKNELERLQQEIIRFQIKHNLMDVDIVASELVSQVSNFHAQLLQKEVEIESYGKISNIKDPGYIKLINEKEAIINALNKLESGKVGDYPPIKDLPKLALELNKLILEAEVQTVAYKALVQQSETLKLTAQGMGSTFQVLEYADIPEIKSGPSRGKLSIIVTFVGFFISILVIFLKEAIIKIKNDPEKVNRLLGRTSNNEK